MEILCRLLVLCYIVVVLFEVFAERSVARFQLFQMLSLVLLNTQRYVIDVVADCCALVGIMLWVAAWCLSTRVKFRDWFEKPMSWP